MNKLIYFLLGIFMVSSVCALGVIPARTTVDFESGLSTQVSFEVLNSEGKDMNLVLAVQGELGEYISLSSATAVISANEGSRTFTYNVNLPDKLEPGNHMGEVVVLELPAGGETSEAYVRATLAVITQLQVYVQYPGKYANSKMIIINADGNGDVTFIFPVVSVDEGFPYGVSTSISCASCMICGSSSPDPPIIPIFAIVVFVVV